MPEASWIALATLIAVALLFLLVLFRKPPEPRPDPAIPLLQAAQERQGERLGTLSGELQAAIARGQEETGKAVSGFTLEQTRTLNAAIATQRERLDAIEKTLIERLGLATQAAAARFEEHRNAQSDAATVLRRDLATATGDLKTGVEAVKTTLAEAQTKAQKSLSEEMVLARELIERKATEGRAQIETKLKEMREANDARLAEINKTVNEQLHAAVEKQMTESFQRVIDQFDAVQRSMVEVQSVTSQIGDLKRLFSNVKTRGGWGEAQCRALLDDILPGGYVENLRPREGSAEAVEFGVQMPNRSETPVYLPLDAKFPIEDYERLLQAAETGDAEGERAARRAMGERVRKQASDIAAKYIVPPVTLDFAVLYLPSDSLYAEVARIPGLLDEIGRMQSVLVLGPSLLPAMLRTIQLGHASFALSKNAEAVKEMLGATRAEMQKMDEVLARLGKQASTFGGTIEKARVRTRAIGRKLRGVDAADLGRARELLELEGEPDPAEEEDEA